MIRPTTVVCKLNDGFGVVPGHSVVGEQGVQKGTEYSVEDQGGGCVATYPHHLGAARQEVQDPVAEEVLSPRILSLVMSFEGTMVLKAEL